MPSAKNGPRGEHDRADRQGEHAADHAAENGADHAVPMPTKHDDARRIRADPEERDLPERKVAGVPPMGLKPYAKPTNSTV